MSENTEMQTPPADERPPVESQGARWLKYGGNVVLSSVVVIALAGIVIWAAQGTKPTAKFRGRADLTSDGSNQLKPQTLSLIRDLPSEVTLVSLYPKLREDETASRGTDTRGRVLDILDEYRKAGTNIKVEAIDPVAEPGKLDAWLGDVKRRYGANIPKYEAFLSTDAPKAIADIRALADAETKLIGDLIEKNQDALQKLPDDQSEKLAAVLMPAQSTLANLPPLLAKMNEQAKTLLEEKIPDYATAIRIVRSGTDVVVPPGLRMRAPGLSGLSTSMEELAKRLDAIKDDAAVMQPVRDYAAAAVPRFRAIKAKADEALKKADELGELKLDDVRRKLMPAQEGSTTPPPAIVVMGASDVRVIDDASLWKSGQSTGMTRDEDDKPKLRFSGEQQLTGAILGLAQPVKQKVAFVRSGGEPLTGRFGMVAELANRLRDYNFDVVEKDFGPPPDPRMPRPPPANEPTEAELAASIWIVASSPDPHGGMMGMGMGGLLGAQIQKHLDAGGSAMVLVDLGSEDLTSALKDWGIGVRPQTVVVHDRIKGKTEGGAASDMIEEARRVPYIFVLDDFGDHPITTPLRSLDAAILPMVPVTLANPLPPGVTAKSIIPVPQTPRSWGETDLAAVRRDPETGRPGADPTFDATADMAGPLFAGAAAERQGKGRLVVIGSLNFARDGILNYADQKLQEKAKVTVSRFPANGELLTNSVFWLAKNEKMIALSPSALDSARVAAIAPGKLQFLRIGLGMALLPLLAVGAGLWMWFSRRG